MKKLFIGSLFFMCAVATLYGSDGSDDSKNASPLLVKDELANFFEQYKQRNEAAVFEYFAKHSDAFVSLKNYALLNGDPKTAAASLHDEKVADGQKAHLEKKYQEEKWFERVGCVALGLFVGVASCGVYLFFKMSGLHITVSHTPPHHPE